nr:reverse transcriptase domain-containing protein [Tanacetum cinerariifolium]
MSNDFDMILFNKRTLMKLCLISSSREPNNSLMSVGTYTSASALLQKADEMGAKESDSTITPILLRGFNGYSTTNTTHYSMDNFNTTNTSGLYDSSLIMNIFPPLDNPELTIRRRSRADPTLLNVFEMATEGNGDPPVLDLRTMKELCQPSLNGQGGPIAPIAIKATNFGLKNDMIQQVQNSCQLHGLSGDDANKHLGKFLHVTQSIKVNGVTDDALYLYLFPHSLTHHATAWFDRGTFMKRRPEECYDLIENMTAHHNDWDTSAQQSGTFMKRRPEECYDLIENMTAHHNDWDTSAQQMVLIPTMIVQSPLAKPRTYMQRVPIKVANDAILKTMQTNMTSLTNFNLELKNMFGQFMKMNTASSSGSGTLPSNTITNLKKDLKGITTQSGTAYQGPTIPTTSLSLPKVVEHETEPVVAPVIEPVAALVSALKPNTKPSIPYPSRLYDQKLCDKANDQKEKFFQIFKDLDFNISFADSLILMHKFGPAIKSLLTNKEKLYELARTSLNEHYSTVLLKKLPEKMGDPGKFLIPCDFSRMDECLALADLGASINLMPLSVWNKLFLPQLTPTLMTLKLADRSISRPIGVAEDVCVKVGKFHFPAEFIVVDFDADPRVPIILERSFLNTGRALIDVFEGELTLRVSKEAITFNLDQTSRYSANYNDMMANRIDVIDMSCKEYSQEVHGFFNVIASGNPTPYYDPIVSTSSLTLTPFGDSDFLLEEVDAFLALKD